MVFFTCNACGASLKKNQVEKHYQNECPTCEVLSCMDCGQDFYGDAYANHTKCISEAEKYQGALYNESGKGGAGKGERKQQEWLERVKESVSGAKVNPRVAGLLERIADYPNIPRKKAKFENFVRNSFNVRDQKTLSQLWDAFSGATKKTQASAVPTDHDKTVAEKQTVDTQAKELTKTDSDDTELVPLKKEKKHQEPAEPIDTSDAGDIAIMNGNGDAGVKDISTEDEVPKRKKKKRKIELLSVNETDAVPVANAVEVESDDAPVIKKIKKKKKQREGDEVGDLQATVAAVEGDGEEIQAAKKAKKKKKRKYKENLDTEDSGHVPGRKRNHEAELDSLGVEGEVVPVAKKHKRSTCRGLDNGGDHDLELQTVIKKHKKKHKHQKEHSLS